MRLDQFCNSILNDKDVFNLLYNGESLSSDIYAEVSEDITKLESQLGYKFKTTEKFDSVNEFDSQNQKNWFMPEEYQIMDIEEFLAQVCPKENYQRLTDELQEFKARNMLDLLRWLKFFVDTSRKHNIIWGVGRGSSVASYVLYLIGVHKIDPIKYNLDYKDFLR